MDAGISLASLLVIGLRASMSQVFVPGVYVNRSNQRYLIAALVISVLTHVAAMTFLPGFRISSPAPSVPFRVALMPKAPNPPAAEVTRVPAKEALKPEPRPRERNVAKAAPVLKLPEPVVALPPAESPLPAPDTVPAAPRETAPAPSAPVERARVQPEPQPAEIDPAMLSGYGQTISSTVAKYQNYPRIAQMRHWAGTAQLRLQVAANGEIIATQIIRSSGYEILDQEAVGMIKRAAPLPRSPGVLRGKEFSVVVPIAFKLE